jgi:TorA maturation chaperone TorD
MSIQTQSTPQTAVPVTNWDVTPGAEEQRYRAGAYSLLANLLRDIPQQDVIDQVAALASLNEQKDELALAMHMLGLAAEGCTARQLDDEYHALFIGLGRGELVPYGSWYLTGFLMETPLARLRDDLAALGYERESDIHEPEDHVAALCEVMAMLISENKPLLTQQQFFEAHLAPWLDRFFDDLCEAKHAVFYRAVGRFGKAFFNLEQTYLAMQA